MSADNAVSLKLRNREYRGWTEVYVTRSIEAAASTFKVSVTERFPGQKHPLRIVPGDACELSYGGDVLITGYVDDAGVSYDAATHSLSVIGRSKTQDLIDCSAINVPGQWRNVKLEDIAAQMADEYGVSVRAEVDTGDPVPDFQSQQGETVFAAVERLARLRALMITDDETGALVLTRAGMAGTAGALTFPGNVKSGTGGFSIRDRFSEYKVKGQRAGNDDDFGKTVAATRGSASDSAVPRKRVLILVAEGQADDARCAARAQWEATSRAGKGLQVDYVVQGWRQSGGGLWRANTLAPVKDAFTRIDRTLLIVATEMEITEGGTITTLALQPAEAFELMPELQVADAAPASEGMGMMAATDDTDWDEEELEDE